MLTELMKNKANIYLGLFMLYNLQGSLYPTGSIISRFFLVILLVMSLYYYGYTFFINKLPIPLKILSTIVVALTIYGIIPIMFGTGYTSVRVNSFDFLKSHYLSLLPIFSFYVFSRKGWLTESLIKNWFIIFIIVVVADYFEYRQLMIQKLSEKSNSNEEVTNNIGYVVLSLMPLLPLFSNKPVLQYFYLAVIMFFVLSGFKRGAILAGVICLIWLIFCSYKMKLGNSNFSRKKHIRLFMTILLVIFAVYLVQYFMISSDYFNYRIEQTLEGYSSERDVLFSFFFNHLINESSVLIFLFGNGAYSSLKLFTNGAHNDWLEMAITCGFLFILIYAAYWISLFKYYYKGKRYSITNIMLGLFIIIYFLASLYSQSINNIPVYASCALGYALAKYEFRSFL